MPPPDLAMSIFDVFSHLNLMYSAIPTSPQGSSISPTGKFELPQGGVKPYQKLFLVFRSIEYIIHRIKALNDDMLL